MRLYTLVLLGPLFFSAHLFAVDTPPTGKDLQIIRMAESQLIMQPGDAQAFARGLQNPMIFTQIPKQREFNGTLLVRAKPGKTKTASARIAPLITQKSFYVQEYVLDLPAGIDEATFASMLMATGDYQYAQPNWTLYPIATVPNDPQFNSSWQHNRIESADAWDLHTGDSSIIVAVCDSGVDLDHPDLQAALVSGYNSATRISQADGGNVDDVNGHGTFVAGCAAAIGNNNKGVVGVGWNLSIMPIRVTNNSNGTANPFSIGSGARWAASNGAQVINVSFSGVMSASNIELAKDLKEMGALLFYAAGNDNTNLGFDRPDFVVVSSTTSSDNKSGFSNYGNAISVAAPGSGVRSTRRGGSYGTGSGTSYASPIAAGVGAMIFSTNPDLGPDDVQEILYASVDDLGASGRDTIYGFGRVNTFNAITDAQNYTPRTVLPINESFESASWFDLFTVTNGSVTVVADAQAPDGSLALALDNTDIIEIPLLAGRPAANTPYIISVMVKTLGVESGESLELQYRDNSGVWISIITMPSFGIDTNGFVRLDAPLDDDFAYHGTSIRILAHGSDASDIWLIDDFRIEPATPLTVPFIESFDSGSLSPFRWDPDETTATIALGNAAVALELTGDTQAETNNIDTTPITEIGAYLNFSAHTTDAINDDSLIIEYRAFSGNWVTLDTIDASQLSLIPRWFSYEIPVVALYTDFRLRISDTDAVGGFFVDDIEIGTEPLIIGCGQADFAEPVGTLDIFDVFAFLDAFNDGDLAADFTDDGTLDIFDFFAFLDAFNAGCP